jgi:hypothetical protein
MKEKALKTVSKLSATSAKDKGKSEEGHKIEHFSAYQQKTNKKSGLGH